MIKLAEKLGVGLYREVAVDLLDVAGEGILGDSQIRGDLLATATLKEELQDEALAGGELGDRARPILRPSHLMKPGDFAQEDVGNAAIPVAERWCGEVAIDSDSADILLIYRAIGDNDAADVSIFPKCRPGIIRVSPVCDT